MSEIVGAVGRHLHLQAKDLRVGIMRAAAEDGAVVLATASPELLLRRVFVSGDAGHSCVQQTAEDVSRGRSDRRDALLLAGVSRRRAFARRAAACGYAVEELTLRVSYRMAVGAGEPTPHGTALAVDRSTAAPMLPAVALTGVARRVSDTPLGWGDTAHPAVATVLDGVASRYRYVHEVTNPHFRSFLQTGAAPVDSDKLKPVGWLAVEDAEFLVLVLAATGDDARAAAEDVGAAVDDLGIGTKTSSGYGYLEVLRP